MTLQDLINSYTVDTSDVSADQAAIAAAQAQAAADQAQQGTDTAALASALATSGPVATVNADGSVTIFSPAPGPAFTTQTYPAAGSVTAPGS